MHYKSSLQERNSSQKNSPLNTHHPLPRISVAAPQLLGFISAFPSRLFLVAKVLLVSAVFISATFHQELLAQTPNLGKGSYFSSIRNVVPKYKQGFTHFDYVNPNAPKGGKITLSGTGSFDSFNPFIVKGEVADGIALIYNSLFIGSEDESSVSYGLLADRIYTDETHRWAAFHIHSDARWHDGKAVTAEDVKWTFDTVIEKGSPQLKLYYAAVQKAEVLKNNTVLFTFKEPNPEMAEILGQLIVLPKHYWTSGDRDFTKTTLKPPLGSGPYRIDKFSPGKNIEYKRVDNYWAKDLNVNRGRYNFDSIRYVYFLNRTAEREALKSGVVDFFQENTSKEWANSYNTSAVKQNRLIKERISNDLPQGMQGFGFNTRREKFSDRRVREAISLAFDFEWANRTLFFNSYTRSRSYFNNSELASVGKPSPAELKLLNPLKDQIPASVFASAFAHPTTKNNGLRKNLLRAKKLLESAGWRVRNNKLINRTGEVFTIEMMLVNPAFERVVTPFAKNLERLGIKLSINTLTTAEYINRLTAFDFDMTVVGFGQSQSPGNEQLYFWGSRAASQAGSRNVIGIKNPAIDSLIDTLIKANSRQELITATRALDRVLLAEHYVVHNWYSASWRILYWNRFGINKVRPSKSIGFFNWWIDNRLDARLEKN